MSITVPTPEQTLNSFASRLASSHRAGEEEHLAPSASLLPCYLSSCSDESSSCILPSLSLKPGVSDPCSCADNSIRSLSKKIYFGKNSIASAPATLLRNISLTFGIMIDSRVKATKVALLKKAIRDGARSKCSGSTNEMGIFQTLTSFSKSSSPISLVATSSNFYTLPPSKDLSRLSDARRKSILPLVIETTIDAKILGARQISLSFQAPGTITGTFTCPTNRLDGAEIKIDSGAFFRSMKDQCRDLVNKAVLVARSSSNSLREITSKELPSQQHHLDDNDVLCMPPPPPRKPRSSVCNHLGSRPIKRQRMMSSVNNSSQGHLSRAA